MRSLAMAKLDVANLASRTCAVAIDFIADSNQVEPVITRTP